MSEPVAVGVDVGGTHLRTAVVARDGRVLDHRRDPTPGADPDDFVSSVAEAVEALGAGLPVGVGVAGVVTEDGRVRYGPNIAAREVPLGARLAERLGVVARVLNDATAAAHAEHRVGVAIGIDDVVLVTAGTGIGGGIVSAGRLVTGAGGLAGEIGHVTVMPEGRRCGCGGDGHVEAYASGRALEAIAHEAVATGARTTLAGDPDAAQVVEHARSGDRVANGILEDAGAALGRGLAIAVTTLDPALIVLGGGAGMALAPWYVPAIEAVIGEQAFAPRVRRLPPVRTAALGDDAGVIGAALAAMDQADEVDS